MDPEDVTSDHVLQELGRDVLAHAVVETTAGEDDLGVVAHGLRLVGEVVGVDPDAVTAHEAGLEPEEVPLRAGRCQDVLGVDPESTEDLR